MEGLFGEREREFCDWTNPLNSYSDKKMRKHYRLSRNVIVHIVDMLTPPPHLQLSTTRSHAIDALKYSSFCPSLPPDIFTLQHQNIIGCLR